jgi:hypothetical protein
MVWSSKTCGVSPASELTIDLNCELYLRQTIEATGLTIANNN